MKVHELFEGKSFKDEMEKYPEVFNGNVACSYRGLTSLEGAPEEVTGDFYCNINQLKSFDGFPKKIGGALNAAINLLKDLHNIHKYIKHIGKYANFESNPIKSHVLGLLLIDGLKKVYLDNTEVQKIINKHLAGDRDVFACQEELIEAGLEDFAQL